MATHTLHLVNRKKGLDVTIQVPGDQTICDAALDAGLDPPSSCGTGNCSSCTERLEGGALEHDNQKFLCDEQLQGGFILLCPTASECRSANCLSQAPLPV